MTTPFTVSDAPTTGILVKIPEAMHKRLKALAKQSGKTVPALVHDMVAHCFGELDAVASTKEKKTDGK